jgi:hypothetical protein
MNLRKEEIKKGEIQLVRKGRRVIDGVWLVCLGGGTHLPP